MRVDERGGVWLLQRSPGQLGFRFYQIFACLGLNSQRGSLAKLVGKVIQQLLMNLFQFVFALFFEQIYVLLIFFFRFRIFFLA